jgi:3-dehydroquinate synthase
MPSAARTVRVNLPGSEYDITVQAGVLADAGQHLRRLTQSKKAAVVTDNHVGPAYAGKLEQSLVAAGFEVIRASVSAGEDRKTLAVAGTIYDQLLSAGIERNTPVLALGGGVIGDMAGFVAATILRGVPFIQVPTTLLAMVDASVGGKTGVNHPVGKNLIGAFHQPRAVLIDPATLETLPVRELRSGLAECIKHDIIRDADGFAHLEKNITRTMKLDMDYLTELVAHNVAIKARVVELDQFENGERAHLNFGHTFGHAIETVSKYSYAHGECVALGMIAASRAAREMAMLDDISVERIVAVIDQAGLPTGGLSLPIDSVLSAMNFDKKVKSGRVRFILPDRIGHVVIRDDVPPDVIRRAVESLR